MSVEERYGGEGFRCRVCGYGLNHAVDLTTGTDSWIHGVAAPQDHEPDPVPITEATLLDMVSVCDVCGRHGARWEQAAEDFVVTEGYSSVAAWALCDDCVRIINDPVALTQRALETFPIELGLNELGVLRSRLEVLYEALQEHKRGDPVALW